MKLVIQIIKRPGDEKVVDGALDSLLPLHGQAKAVVFEADGPRDQARNSRIKDADWHLALEPWERITSGHEALAKALAGPPAVYRLMIHHGDLITKEARLWHRSTGATWRSPVFENLQPDQDARTLPVLVSSGPHDHRDDDLRRIAEWKQAQPAAAEPLYYEACVLLSQGRFDEFIGKANAYLFKCHAMSMSVAMTRYYLAVVHCHVRKEPRQALENMLVPLALRPLMAEFWCLLADIHYFLSHDYDKAARFYEAAKTMGQGRKSADAWPIQLSKYSDYPDEMLDSCRSIRENLKVIQIVRTSSA